MTTLCRNTTLWMVTGASTGPLHLTGLAIILVGVVLAVVP